MNRLYQKLAQVFFTSALVMGTLTISNAQFCNHQFDLSSFSTGIYYQNHLELRFPEAIVVPLAEIDMNFSVQKEYELMLWVKGGEFEGGGLSLSLSGANSVEKLIDNQILKEGIYRVPFPYSSDFSHLQLHWGDNCTQGKIQLMSLGVQEKTCELFDLGNEVGKPSLWLNADGPYGQATNLQTPNAGFSPEYWQNLSDNALAASQSEALLRPELMRNPSFLEGQAYLKFDGFNDMMSIDWGGALPQSGFSQFVVFRTNNDYGTIIAQTDTPTFNASLHQSETGFNYGHMIHRLNVNGQNTYAQSYFKIDDQRFHIGYVHVPDTSFRSLWIDGNYVGANPTNNHNDFLSHLLIGGHANYGYFDGDIAEILLFEDILSQSAIEQVQSYLSFKYQIPLETQYRLSQGDSLLYDTGFTYKTGSIGVDLDQYLRRTKGTTKYRDAKMTISAANMPNQSQLLWANDIGELSLTADIYPRKNNRLARTWRVWQTSHKVGELELLLEGFPEGLQTMITHPSAPLLPIDDLVQVFQLEKLGDGNYRVRFKPEENTYLSFSSEVSPLMDVQWSGFDGLVEAPMIELSWSTSRERYTEAFVLERSFDGLLYQPIAKLNAAYRSDTEQYYTYVDQEIAQFNSDLIHYRLKVLDPNGAFRYSPRLEMRLPAFRDLYFEANVLPTKVLRLNYFHKKESPLQGRVLNQNGQVIESFLLGLGPQQNQIEIDLSHLPAGIYSIELYDEVLRELKRFILDGQ